MLKVFFINKIMSLVLLCRFMQESHLSSITVDHYNSLFSNSYCIDLFSFPKINNNNNINNNKLKSSKQQSLQSPIIIIKVMNIRN